MARSPAEIQADIALTRRVIEHQLDALSRRVPNPHWVPWLAVAGTVAAVDRFLADRHQREA